MDLNSIAAKIAGYDFRSKMKLNALVLEELGRALGQDDLNEVAISIQDSPVHKAIQELADAIDTEASRQKASKSEAA